MKKISIIKIKMLTFIIVALLVLNITIIHAIIKLNDSKNSTLYLTNYTPIDNASQVNEN